MRRLTGVLVAALLALSGTAVAGATPSQLASTTRISAGGVGWQVQTSPFRISFLNDGKVVTQEPASGLPGPGGRLSFQTVSGERYALTDAIRSRSGSDGTTYVVGTTYPGHRAEVLLTPLPDGVRVAVSLHPAAQLAYFFESLTAGMGQHFLGTGQRSMFVDLARQVVPIEVLFQPAWYDSTCATSAVSVPYFLSSAGYGVNINNTNVGKLAFPGAVTKPQTGTILPAGAECPHDQPDLCPIATLPQLDRTQICLQSNRLSYDVYVGSFTDITRAHGAQVGYPRMATAAQFGLMKWRDYLPSGKALLRDVRELRRRGIPVSSVTIDNPWELAAPKQTGTAGLTASCVGTLRFNDKRIRHPRQLVAQLHRMHTKVLLWVAPFYFDPAKTGCPRPAYPRGSFVRGANIYTFPPPADQFSPAAPLDLDLTNPATARAFRKHLVRVFAVGIDGVKGDRGDETDFVSSTFHGGAGRRIQNRYPVLYARIVMDALSTALRRQGRNPHRVMTQWRAASTGSASAVPAIWTADQTMDSIGFRSAVRMVLTAGPSGFPVTGPDIGGYLGEFTDQVGFDGTPLQTSDKLPTPSLFSRWAQLGAVSPFMEVAAPGPNFSKQFYDRWGADVVARFRAMAVLHYSLFPVFWQLERRAHRTGSPIVRPLGFDHPEDAAAWRQEREGMIGRNLLFAMVSSPASLVTDALAARSLVRVYLPRGRWVDLFKASVVRGGRTVVRDTPLEDFPFYLRSGEAVPFNARLPIWSRPWGLQELRSKTRAGWLWAPANRTVHAATHDQGRFTARSDGGVLSIRLRSPARESQVLVVTRAAPRRVVVNGSSVPRAASEAQLRTWRNGWTRHRGEPGEIGGFVVKVTTR